MKKNLKRKLEKYQLKLKKSLGQNFLIDQRVVKKMIEAARLKRDDLVLEVGPGLGGLTRETAKQVKRVIAIEMDKKLIRAGQQELADLNNIELINQDILRVDIGRLIRKKRFKILSSLPYQISSPFLRKLGRLEEKPQLVVLLIQREVAERVKAEPGDSSRGYLTILVQAVYRVEIISLVGQEAFWPQPKVESAIIRLVPRTKILVKDWPSFIKVVQAGFGQRRKKLINSLTNRLDLEKERVREIVKDCRLDQNIRAQDLTIPDWLKLSQRLRDYY